MTPTAYAFVFARGGSKGLPRKNVRLLGGKPLIQHSIETAQACPYVETVIVSTDDEEIAAAARDAGAEVPFRRPAALAGDHAPEWLAWQHAVRTIREIRGEDSFDVFLSLPPTSPLRAVEDVSACVERLRETDADLVVTATEAHRNPYYNQIVLAENGDAHLAIPPEAAFVGRQTAPVVYDMTTVAYAARPEHVLRMTGIIEGRVQAVLVPPERAIDIDTELDFAIAELLLARKGSA